MWYFSFGVNGKVKDTIQVRSWVQKPFQNPSLNLIDHKYDEDDQELRNLNDHEWDKGHQVDH